MYPNWPESDADLVPLPLCPGPKLRPFDFQGPQKIEFLEYLGKGAHSHVIKVRILDQIYALKVFRWVWDNDWIGRGEGSRIDPDNLEAMSAIYNYSEPFSAECRAFGRLQESNHEELALQCFGYALLDEDHERRLMAKCNLDYFDFNGNPEMIGNCERGGIDDIRIRFVGKNGRPPPLRCIVKAFGQGFERDEIGSFRKENAQHVLRSIIQLHKLAIMWVDVAIRQLIDGKLCDFSTAITMPHFLTSPELNPKLNPPMIDAITKSVFGYCKHDYVMFDEMINEWNDYYAEEQGRIRVCAYPNNPNPEGLALRPNERYNFRNSTAKKRFYTLIDPKKYGWTAGLVDGESGETPPPKRGQLGRGGKIVKRQPCQGKDVKVRFRKVTARPEKWYYDYEEKDMEWVKDVRLVDLLGGPPGLYNWWYQDGHLFPFRNRGGALK